MREKAKEKAQARLIKMNSLLYIILRSLKNRILELKRKPALLILYIVVAALLIFSIISVSFNSNESVVSDTTSLLYLKAALFGLIASILGLSIHKGVSTGSSFFSMSDVNLLFVSPLSAKKILIYGLIKQIGTLLLMTFVLLCQYANLKNIFGLSFSNALFVFGAFIIGTIFCQLLPMAIYMLTNGSKKRKRFVIWIAIACLAPLLCHLLYQVIGGSGIVNGLLFAIDSNFASFTPIVGWITESAFAFIEEDIGQGVLYTVLSVVAIVVLIALIAYSKAEYYEDVLGAAETAYEKQAALQDGNLNAATVNKAKKVNVTATGIAGYGAAALFGKHMRESFRSNFLKVIDTTSIVYIVATAIAAFAMSDTSKNLTTLIIIMGFSMYMMLLTIGTGKGMKDLYSQYIYLIPASAFQKLIWSSAEIFLRILVESVLMFIVFGVIAGGNPFILLMCMIVRTLFAVVLVGVNVISMRIFKTSPSAAIMLLFYFLIVILLMLPGVVGTIILAVIVGGDAGIIAGLLLLSAWEMLVGALLLFLGRSVLHNCDIATMAQK